MQEQNLDRILSNTIGSTSTASSKFAGSVNAGFEEEIIDNNIVIFTGCSTSKLEPLLDSDRKRDSNEKVSGQTDLVISIQSLEIKIEPGLGPAKKVIFYNRDMLHSILEFSSSKDKHKFLGVSKSIMDSITSEEYKTFLKLLVEYRNYIDRNYFFSGKVSKQLVGFIIIIMGMIIVCWGLCTFTDNRVIGNDVSKLNGNQGILYLKSIMIKYNPNYTLYFPFELTLMNTVAVIYFSLILTSQITRALYFKDLSNALQGEVRLMLENLESQESREEAKNLLDSNSELVILLKHIRENINIFSKQGKNVIFMDPSNSADQDEKMAAEVSNSLRRGSFFSSHRPRSQSLRHSRSPAHMDSASEQVLHYKAS